jgi:hypothetical protein
MEFGAALAAVKAGQRISREGWNGKHMFVAFQPGYPAGIPINENTSKAIGAPIGTVVAFRPYLMMFTAQGDCVPWVASQTDLLADDWVTVE